jgi:hypothetical protein
LDKDQTVIQTTYAQFYPLLKFLDNQEQLQKNPPLLAHYTSLETFEKIVDTSELWFSNPLFMNDLEEMRFGLHEGARIFKQTNLVSQVAGSKEREQKIRDAFDARYAHIDSEGALDVYVFCFTEHPKDNTDGLLSMWRGYGGSGHSVALVFDTGKINWVATAPIFLLQVGYETYRNRVQSLNDLLAYWGRIVRDNKITDDLLWVAGVAAFSVIKLYSLTTKHSGFSEEKEWRAVYLQEADPNALLKPMMGYAIGDLGIEPKLKFKFEKNSAGNFPLSSMSDVLDRIILGPSISNSLARLSVQRMLQNIDKADLAPRVVASTIPLRTSLRR